MNITVMIIIMVSHLESSISLGKDRNIFMVIFIAPKMIITGMSMNNQDRGILKRMKNSIAMRKFTLEKVKILREGVKVMMDT